MLNKSGDNTHPYLTPFFISLVSDVSLPIPTWDTWFQYSPVGLFCQCHGILGFPSSSGGGYKNNQMLSTIYETCIHINVHVPASFSEDIFLE